MTVIVANDTPEAVRGMLKRWFIEPKPNVFVGTLNPRTHAKVMDYIRRNSPPELGMLVISSQANCQGYTVERMGPCGCQGRNPEVLSGIALVAEQWVSEDANPF